LATIQAILLGLLLAGAAFLTGNVAQASVDPAEALITELMCPTTSHYEPLATSNSPDAAWMRGFIRSKFDEGWPRQRVVDTLVRQYGAGILPAPPKEGFSLAAWITPLVTMLGGVAAVGFVLTRWLRERKRQDAYLDAEIARNIDESDMQRYEAQLLKELEQFE
jgi:cytochrome c-type biogenesis protein CcmH/NrfF